MRTIDESEFLQVLLLNSVENGVKTSQHSETSSPGTSLKELENFREF